MVIPRENALKDMLKHWCMAFLLVTVDIAVSEVDIRASGALAVLILLIPVSSNYTTHPSARVLTVLQNPVGKTVIPEVGNVV